MSRHSQTLSAEYFEGLYGADSDPWKFATSAYEREKYARTLAALPRSRYSSALEVGCSIGVLTNLLAARCDRLLAIDAAATPLEQARLRCRHHAHVQFAEMFVPAAWPEGQFDLILLSEVVYYLNEADVAALVERIAKALASRGTVALVHWTGETNYPLSGDEAAELFTRLSKPFADLVRSERQPQYRLDILARR
jgi:trans-aconitate methyltransferase